MTTGTAAANAARILLEGFKPSDPAKVAATVERALDLPEASVLKHFAFQFPLGRRDLDHVHFISKFDVAQQYTVPEQLQDALAAAYLITHEKPEGVSRRFRDHQDAWVKAQASRLTRPMVLAVTMPWAVLGDHGFGRRIELAEYLRIADGELPYSVAIPISALQVLSIAEASK